MYSALRARVSGCAPLRDALGTQAVRRDPSGCARGRLPAPPRSRSFDLGGALSFSLHAPAAEAACAGLLKGSAVSAESSPADGSRRKSSARKKHHRRRSFSARSRPRSSPCLSLGFSPPRPSHFQSARFSLRRPTGYLRSLRIFEGPRRRALRTGVVAAGTTNRAVHKATLGTSRAGGMNRSPRGDDPFAVRKPGREEPEVRDSDPRFLLGTPAAGHRSAAGSARQRWVAPPAVC